MSSLRGTGSKTRPLSPVWGGGIGDHVIGLAWSPKGEYLAAAAVSGPITVFDGETGMVQHRLAGHAFGTTAIGWSADGAHFASAGQDGSVRLWDVASGTERAVLEGGSAWVEHLAWSPHGNLLAVAAGKKLHLWDADANLIRSYPDHPSTIYAVAWQPGENVLTSAAYGQITLWTTAMTEPIRRFEWKGSILSIAWSPNGRFIATGDQDSTCGFWYVREERQLRMWGYPTKVRELAWDPTSTYLATGGGNIVTIWNCGGRKGPEGTRPLQFEAHRDVLTALAYQRAGLLLASGGQDGLVCLWNPTKASKLLGMSAFETPITQLAWSPNDRTLAVGTDGGEVEVFPAP